MAVSRDNLAVYCTAARKAKSRLALRQILADLVLFHFHLDPNFLTAVRFLDALYAEIKLDIENLNLSAPDAHFAESCWNALINWPLPVEENSYRVRQASANYDFIVENREVSDWSLFKTINFVVLVSLQCTKHAAVVTSIRNEGLSILEWIAHYQAIGFEGIYIYANSNTDESSTLLKNLAHHGIIHYIENENGKNVSPQRKAFEHSIHFLHDIRKYEWVCYLDADEFLIPRCEPELTIQKLTEHVEHKLGSDRPIAILYNWKWFGSENAFERTDGLLLERFVYSKHNKHVKTLSKLWSIISMWPIHFPIFLPGVSVYNSSLQEIPIPMVEIEPTYGTGQINHYWNKSFCEFVIKKFRGRGALAMDGEQRPFETFFQWGNNYEKGNYDPPIERILTATRVTYSKLLQLEGVADALYRVEEVTKAELEKIDKQFNLRAVYEKKGRL
ncbi:Glycosyltransferase family 2 protein [Rhodovastum atsumiense]|uniref:Glycosyltransferase family 2 protein n=1 Tax=Rhodovastum atsumiense TaxID=504468 RepID=A0A5M6IM04_9PROT|nr:glycosyltransferase family 2 protein [Rhodovastum atsumiense]KAA5608588.1 glycosyltransferase family 2 protein [Rhodovastum atsumiense]CAH2603409.1 Glycosyltransferase family 2 protein [Rhodovastum atsumiense]